MVPRALARDWRTAPLSDADRAMLAYAAKLTRAPGAVTDGDVATLRDAGFDDAAVLDICQVVSYFNYVNRLADGLGVEMEGWWTDDQLTLPREEFDARKAEEASDG